jgi:hypothetical protein
VDPQFVANAHFEEERQLILGSVLEGRLAILKLPHNITVAEVIHLGKFVRHIQFEAEQREKAVADNLKAAQEVAAKEETKRVEPIRVAPALL